jgi:hypothetical protein
LEKCPQGKKMGPVIKWKQKNTHAFYVIYFIAGNLRWAGCTRNPCHMNAHIHKSDMHKVEKDATIFKYIYKHTHVGLVEEY